MPRVEQMYQLALGSEPSFDLYYHRVYVASRLRLVAERKSRTIFRSQTPVVCRTAADDGRSLHQIQNDHHHQSHCQCHFLQHRLLISKHSKHGSTLSANDKSHSRLLTLLCNSARLNWIKSVKL